MNEVVEPDERKLRFGLAVESEDASEELERRSRFHLFKISVALDATAAFLVCVESLLKTRPIFVS
jgi:hypothetical protein